MGKIYKNKTHYNQRGGGLIIDNTTEQEKVKLYHRSGSNVNMTNVVTAELASNNKQLLVLNDSFETVNKDKGVYVGGNLSIRTGENTYEFKGFQNNSEFEWFEKWKEAYRPIANLNSQFKISRGGFSLVGGSTTPLAGVRSSNPTLNNQILTVENPFKGYTGKVPVRTNDKDDVVDYSTVIYRPPIAAAYRSPAICEIEVSAGDSGSKAPGILEFGSLVSSSTEGGNWQPNEIASDQNIIDETEKIHLLKLCEEKIEENMGHGGDDIQIVKRNRLEQIGATFNDFPSIRIDEFGRSQPLEMVVAPKAGAYKNHDYIPHVEEVDNSSNFPCGNDDKTVGNRYSRYVGSGGINLKTVGSFELGGSILKAGFKKISINASHGVHIASESSVEIQSLKTITLRTNRQVFVESSLGVSKNLVVGGGIYAEGEVFLHHVTAPLEVHQTQDTVVMGKFATDSDRTLLIGETYIGGVWYPTYAKATDNLLINYPHSHHHHGIPMRLTQANEDVRVMAEKEGINSHGVQVQALPQIDERKDPLIVQKPC